MADINGTPVGETLDGTSGDDSINGFDGDDLLRGFDGNDILDGGAGDDQVRGNAGDDQLIGGDGNDNLRGGPGTDSFDGGDAGEGDPLDGFGDRVSFYEPNAIAGVVADLRTGVISNDGFGNVETMVGIESLGSDTAFVDTFHGNDGRNAFFANLGDNLHGHGGEDLFYISSAAAVVDGGEGADTLQLDHSGGWLTPDQNGDGIPEQAAAMTSGWAVNLAAGSFTDGYGNSGTVTSVENVFGSNLDDSIEGDDLDNTLWGSGGNDWLDGGGGNDFMQGGTGNDIYVVEHGDGVDEAADAGTDEVRTAMNWGLQDNVENLTATGDGNTFLGGNALDNALTGNSGHNYIRGEGGSDWIDAGGGWDTAAFGLPVGTVGTLRIVQAGDGALLVQLVQADGTSQDVFRVDPTGPGSATVTGLNIMSGLGTDTVTNVEDLHFFVDTTGGPIADGQFVNILLTPATPQIMDNFAHVSGSVMGDSIDLAALYPGATPEMEINSNGGLGDDSIFGSEDGNWIGGDEGDDHIDGRGGDDGLSGGAGTDSLHGGEGNDYIGGEDGDDTIDGGGGHDVAAFQLPAGTPGTLRVVVQPDGSLLVQLVQADDSFEDIFHVVPTGQGAATVTGLGIASNFGTDTVTSVEDLHFSINTNGEPHGDGQFVGIPLVPYVPTEGFLHVSGSVAADTIDLASLYPEATVDTPVNADGNLGDDSIFGTEGGNYVEGNAGNDYIDGRGGDDTLVGGEGDDHLVGGDGSDGLVGGAGNDVLDGGEGQDFVQFVLPSMSGTLQVVEGPDGTLLVQLVQGDVVTDVFSVVSTEGGGFIVTGLGDIAGHLGTDTVTGVEDLHFLIDGADPYGSGQFTTIWTQLYVPPIDGNNFAHVSGSPVDDAIDLAGLYPGATVATRLNANGGLGADTIVGHDGRNGLAGNQGDDTLDGRGGNDGLNGGAGNDDLLGGDGHDLLTGGSGDDLLDGGAGGDRAAFTGSQVGVQVDLRLQGQGQDTGAGIDTLVGIESVTGTGFDDTLTGDDGANSLWGSGGNDTLSGSGGDDYLGVTGGDHVLDGGSGTDTIAFVDENVDAPGPITVDLSVSGPQSVGIGTWTISNVENVGGGNFDDVLTGTVDANILAGAPGNDTLNGGGGDDLLLGDGYLGVDVTNPSQAWFLIEDGGEFGAIGNDILRGGEGNDTIIAGGGDDTLNGGAGNDHLDGGAGDDSILTGFGVNAVDGGDGFDIAYVQIDTSIADTVQVTGSDGAVTVAQGGVVTNSVTNAEEVQVRTNGGGAITIDATGYVSSPGTFLWLIDHNGTDVMIGSAGSEGFGNIHGNVDGNDTFTGNGGADVYDYTYAASGMNGDTITDFDADDVIDLRFNDSVENEGGVLAHTFIGDAAFSGAAGEYRYYSQDGQTFIEADTDGDGVADQTLTLANGEYTLVETAPGSNILVRGDVAPIEGVVADGLIAGATVFIDTDGDGQLDTDEVSATTEEDGSFTLASAPGSLVAFGGVNTDTGLLNTVTLTAPGGSTVVNPLTTLVQAVMEGSTTPLTAEEAADIVAASLGISSSIDLLNTDVFTAAGNGDAAALEAQKAAAMVVSLIVATSDAAGTDVGEDVIASLADAVATGDVDLTEADTVAGVLDGIVSEEEVAALAVSVSEGAQQISDSTDLEEISENQAAAMTTGNELDNVLTGGALADELRGFGGVDQLFGNGGDDRLDGGLGDDELDGGAGTDTALYDAAASGVVVSLTAGTAAGGAGTDSLTGIENVVGSSFGDRLTGSSADNLLDGGAGADQLKGVDGNDTLVGGAGGDTLDGGTGNDTADYSGSAAGVSINLVAGKFSGGDAGGDKLIGIENVVGSALGDVLVGNQGNNILDGGAGNDTINGGGSADVLSGGAGADLFEFKTAGEISTGSGFDAIMDLETGDIIDLSALDANTRTARKDDAFTFVGEGAFSGTAGELRFEASEDGGCVVMGDIDGDGAADFQLYIASTDMVTADYFVL